MKIRNDFVTNSSSSSFVIMFRDMPDIDKQVVEKYPFIKNYTKMMEKLLVNDSEKVSSIEELNTYFLDQYGWSKYNTIEKILENDEYLEKNYSEYKTKIKEGYSIIFKTIDYNDESASDMLHSLDDGVNFIVRSDE